jgi:hypothetical protein
MFMDSTSKHETLGVFAPVGHVIVSFPTQQDMTAAADALRDAGFADTDLTRYSADQMREQVDLDRSPTWARKSTSHAPAASWPTRATASWS